MEWIDSVLREVAELPNRNSPEDWPEAMLVTGAELRQVIVAHAPAEAVNAMVMEALRVNHQWHIDFDDFDGYPGSDLEAMNLAAIAAAEARQAGPVRLTEADLEECKRLADAGSPVPHMSWSQRLAFAVETAVLERNGLKPQAKGD